MKEDVEDQWWYQEPLGRRCAHVKRWTWKPTIAEGGVGKSTHQNCGRDTRLMKRLSGDVGSDDVTWTPLDAASNSGGKWMSAEDAGDGLLTQRKADQDIGGRLMPRSAEDEVGR
jgi:hypothetical protein